MRLVPLLLLASFLPLAWGLSPPQMVDVVFGGTPSKIDSDGGMWVAVSFADRPVLGLYRVDLSSYVEFEAPSRVDKTVFAKEKVVALLSTRNSLFVVDLASKQSSIHNLEMRAGGLATDGRHVYVSYPAARTVVKLDPESLKVLESYDVDVADGLSYLSASDGAVWAVARSLDSLVVVRNGVAESIRVEGSVVRVEAVEDAAWLVLNNDNVLKVSGGSIVQRTSLPRATFPSSTAVIGDKLVYSSVSRRVVGVVDQTGYRESSLASASPSSVAAGAQSRIWFLDSISNKIGFIYDSRTPTVSNWVVNRLQDGSAEVRVRVSDPEQDLASVKLVAVEYTGIYVAAFKEFDMVQRGEIFTGVYRQSAEVSRVELYVNATDVAGNNVYQKVGELDYRTSTTSPSITIATTPEAPPQGQTVLSLLTELLLLIPLFLVLTVFVLNRSRRKPRKKK
ncbi:MAG: hypothetical protein QXH14_00440 [Candidatus Caldarchaeum sp.]